VIRTGKYHFRVAFPSTKHQNQHIYECFCIGTDNTLVDEFDEQDDNNTTYAVLFDGKLPAATARLMQSKTDSLSVRIGRVATLKQYRGQKYGSQVFQALEKMATKSNYKKVIVHAELTAAEFYEKLGSARYGKTYQEDKTDCITLTKTLD
jgi:Predicted acyltransferase